MTHQTSQTPDARWWFGSLAVTKLAATQTDGRISIVEVTEPPGAEAPLHVHTREDETFWVLDGEVTFEVGGTTVHAGPGDVAFGPRDVPHRYEVGAAGCRMLFILTPGGFEGAIREMSTPARALTLPPSSEAPPDMSGLEAAIASYGCEILAGEGAGDA